ncbi:class I SAM-dependent methyltransferase [Burkholderia sp. WSM2232]|uniref:class I SAM-dependent methyltransferase n=1 Tax=Burkholderia sp. WSM2232 TaxID=944436 RepID=UPI000489527A|nr:class I SAM-dependent methyltransferase [Burkholderia sp. WSM2232]
MSTNASGTEGYAEEAGVLIRQWRGISFSDRHAPVLHLLPTVPSRVLDVGAGVGTDAAALAAMGHAVVAVEPVDELRSAASDLHRSSRVEWIDDSLPDLAIVGSRQDTFDLVMLTAVWMHLDREQRCRAMPRVSGLLRDGGRLIMSLRHGPAPAGRRVFEVCARETIGLASASGLEPVLQLLMPSVQPGNRRAGVTWTRLAFEKRVAHR